MNRIRAVGGIAGITFLSRITGYARDKVLALVLGAGMQSDAFIVAFRIPNLFRALLAEGSLHAAFIPVFTEKKASSDKKELWDFARHFLYSLTFLLTGLTLLGILTSPWIVQLFAAEFTLIPGKMELTVLLNRWMFPYLFFISLAGLFQGILNAHDRFYLPAATPIFLNLSMILGGLSLGTILGHPSYGFTAGVLFGGFLQMFSQYIVARKLGLKILPTLPFRHPLVFKVFRLMLPGVFALGIYQINELIGTRFAAHVGNAAVSHLYYAYRVNHLVYGGIVVSIFTVFLPGLSRETEDQTRFTRTLSSGIHLGLWITLPALTGLWILAGPIIRVLFEGGEFTGTATPLVAEALGFYAISLPAYALSKMLSSAYFARQDTATPAWSALFNLLVFTSGCFLLIPYMAHAGIALATSIGGYVQVFWLALFLNRRRIFLPWMPILREGIKVAAASALMAGVLLLSLANIFEPFTGSLTQDLLLLVFLIAAGSGTFFAACRLFRVEAFHTVLSALKKGERP